MDTLTEMHLLLRQHGWEPERDEMADWWEWSLVGCTIRIITKPNEPRECVYWEKGVIWSETDAALLGKVPARERWKDHTTVAELRLRLQELSAVGSTK